MSVRIFVAVAEADYARLYDLATRERLERLGTVVRGEEHDGRVTLPAGLADDFDILITSWTTRPFDPQILHGERLRLAVHSAGSVRGLFPVEALAGELRLAQGGSDAMAEAVAEMAVALTLAQVRGLIGIDRRFQRTRDWRAGGNGELGESVSAQRIGLVALSRVGRHYARMIRGLGATRLRAYDPFAIAADAEALGVELCGLEELCATSDVLAIHAPVTPETRGLIGASQLRLLPDNAIVINTARAEVTDEAALFDEVRSGRLRVGLDVFAEEPLSPDSDLFGRDNAILLPHVAGGTVQARFAQGAQVVDEIERFVSDGVLRSEVTAANYAQLS